MALGMLCLGLGMRVFRMWQWVLGVGLLLGGCSLNPQPFPPFDSDGGAGSNGDAAYLPGSDAGSIQDATKGTDGDAGIDAPFDAPLDGNEAGDAMTDADVEGG